MRKYQHNSVVDILVFTLFVLLVATGALMKFVLPKGSGESLAVWGLGRHDWGGAPVEYLIRRLRLPADVSRTRPLRELRDAHGFTMDDVRRVVADYRRSCD